MARTLDVYLYERLCGKLTQDDTGQIGFAYTQDWLDSSGPTLSQSLPLRPEPFGRKEAAGFFGGILPEQPQRDKVAANLGISKKNDFAMLELIGGECAGAVTFALEGSRLPAETRSYRPLTSPELAEIIKQLPRRPLLAGEEGIRMSLAGAQSKLALYVGEDRFSIPQGSALSTHIIKPAIPEFEGIVFNEALCLDLATRIGLNTASAEARRVEDLDYLLIQRYDRIVAHHEDGKDTAQRLHQEDFCQALGVVSELKYQNEGGPSLKQCFQLLRDVSSVPVIDLQMLLNGAIFNFLIGNNDAHGKNFSLLYTESPGGRQTRLAPFYDLISTTFYPDLSSKMAMKIGSEYKSEKVFAHHFDQFVEEVGFSKSLARNRVPDLAKKILEHLPHAVWNEASSQIASHIQERCEKTIDRFSKAAR